jgi:putative ABC transport system substrate-binding protein
VKTALDLARRRTAVARGNRCRLPLMPGPDLARRRWLLYGAALLLAPRRVLAQMPKRVPTIGILRWVRDAEHESGLRLALRERGYVEGRTVVIEERWADGRSDVAARLAAELVRANVDLIITAATPALQAAWTATRTIPIVSAGAADPVASGFAASLARPGGNVTGISYNLPALAGKRLELVREAFPGITRVAFLGSKRDPAVTLFVENTEAASKRLGLVVHVALIREIAEVDAALGAIVRDRARALIVQPIFGYGQSVAVVTHAALKHRLPAMSDFPEFADASGLMSYGPSRQEATQRVADYVDRIFNGAKAGELPIVEPSTFDLVVNLKTAAALGVTIPPALLLRAARLIE